MLRTRIIPCLLLHGASLVKTEKFNKFKYIGDPLNTCRIFNELEVDEMAILDIRASKEGKEPNYKILKELASECFMPLSYGGGINNIKQAEKIFSIGYEKIVINSAAIKNPNLIKEISKIYGNQSIIVSIDIKQNIFKQYEVYCNSGTINTKKNPKDWALEVQKMGAGEILLTNISREGTWSGFDTEIVKKISEALEIPVIAHGGAGTVKDIIEVVKEGKASAVALGSMVVFQKKGMGVLVNFPHSEALNEILKFGE
jgi:cyclase